MKRIYIIAVLLIAAIVGTAVVFEPHDPVVQTESTLPPAESGRDKHARFEGLAASPDTRRAADWVVRSGDHGDLPFVIIDKGAASLHVFDTEGRAHAATPVLLGLAKGDRFAPGSADKDMYQTRPDERITPAGRFLAERGINDKGHHVVWIQYDAGIAMHAVLDNPRDRRLQRLQTPTPDDNRISYGCVNVPTEFYRDVVRPLFERTRAIVYVLPDSEDVLELFASAPSAAGRLLQ